MPEKCPCVTCRNAVPDPETGILPCTEDSGPHGVVDCRAITSSQMSSASTEDQAQWVKVWGHQSTECPFFEVNPQEPKEGLGDGDG